MRQLIKRLIHPILKIGARAYLRKPRRYVSRGLRLTIPPSVFHPGMYLSTNMLADFALDLDVQHKKVLELGAGSGFISLLLARKGAFVTASDVNPLALETLEKNAAANQLELRVVRSDLFETLDPKDFDYLLINPPYYPMRAKDYTEAAFFCGEAFEYFEIFFSQLQARAHLAKTECYMILSEDCQLDKIKAMASQRGFGFLEVLRKKKRGEWNFIFRIVPLEQGVNKG